MWKVYAPIVLFVAGVVVLNSSAYIITETQQAIITQFGQPKGNAIVEPGLHWKLPFIQKVLRFDKRWLEWDGGVAEMPTSEKTFVVVDAYARWRISDPLKFYQSLGTENVAQTRLDDIINSAVRNVVASHRIIEVVRMSNREFTRMEDSAVLEELQQQEGMPEVELGRRKLAQMVQEKASEAMPDYGIKLVDVQFQRVIYTQSVKKKVFDRMVAERNRIAERYRSEGQGKQAEILGKKERELKEIRSEAYRKAERIKGEADAKATAIYADSHSRDPELYQLMKRLDSYRNAVDENTTLLMSTDSEFYQSLTSSRP